MSARRIVVLTTSEKPTPPAARISPMFFMSCVVCSSTESPANFIVSGMSPRHPETYSIPPDLMACEYGPSAAGALSVDTTSFDPAAHKHRGRFNT
eukprot:CAMPEP_0170141846 /NCGR_PEP_ID=MMETSP0033_2-20121228/7258_1 /TAXON_ID=195969 /ORGANISM="Dolichomastix tenuilepis, Strain CCMP3274" /LENGTH=94 /DNA_ID=CAMNT_0010378137 /DNA_START=196 /DNA_END=480 /DNA_ORIENTATION=-